MIDGFPKEQVIKIMLQVAKRKRELTKLERKYDKKIKDVGDYRTKEIMSLLNSKLWISQTPVFIPSPDPTSVKMFPFNSSDGEGLSPKGDAILLDLIESFERDRIGKRKDRILGVSKFTFTTIVTIVSGLVIAFLSWYFGWL